MSIRPRWICIRKGGSTYTFALHSNKMTTPSICVRVGNETLYCPLYNKSLSPSGLVVLSGTNREAVNVTPTLNFQVYCSQDTSTAYRYGYTYTIRNIYFSQGPSSAMTPSLRNATSIQCKIVGETSANAAGTWTTIATLPANSTSMGNPSAVRVLGSSTNQSYYQVRIVISGNVVWTFGNYGLYTWYNVSRAISSTYW